MVRRREASHRSSLKSLVSAAGSPGGQVLRRIFPFFPAQPPVFRHAFPRLDLQPEQYSGFARSQPGDRFDIDRLFPAHLPDVPGRGSPAAIDRLSSHGVCTRTPAGFDCLPNHAGATGADRPAGHPAPGRNPSASPMDWRAGRHRRDLSDPLQPGCRSAIPSQRLSIFLGELSPAEREGRHALNVRFNPE